MTAQIFPQPETQTPSAQPHSQNFPNLPTAEKSSQLDTSSLNDNRNPDTKLHASNSELPPNQQHAIELLALGQSYKIVAATLGIDRRTLFNWRSNPLFQSELHRRHAELWGQTTDRLRMLLDPSLEVLAEHLNDTYDRNRFRAAATILRLAKLRDHQ